VVDNEEDGIAYIVDPGLGLVEPIPVDPEKMIEIADRTYRVILVDEDTTLEVTKPDQSKFHFRFTQGDGINLEENVQKPLFRATPSFKIDAFNQEGHKTASIKMDFIQEHLDYFIHGQQSSIDFADIEEFVGTPDFERLMEVLEDP